MRCSRIVGLSLSALVASGIATPMHAANNMSGQWAVTITFPSPINMSFMAVWEVAQVGTVLSVTSVPGGILLTGTIGSDGEFTVSDPATLCSCHDLPCVSPDTDSGTVAPDGLTFTGTYFVILAPPPGGYLCASGDANVTGSRSPATTCGNGVVDPGEQCDDGAANGTPTSCCSVGCTFDPPGISCHSNVCVDATACDEAGHCVGAGVPCDQCSQYDSAAACCVASPATSCKTPTVPGGAQLRLKMAPGHQPRLRWTWTKGQATTLADFGDPEQTDAYALCAYDESGAIPSALLRATVPPGTDWQPAGANGFKYKNKLGTADGVTGIHFKAGAAGKSKITITGQGAGLVLPALPLALPVAVQLRGHGECWGAGYVQAGVTKHTLTEFLGKSSPSGAFLDARE